MLRIKQDPLSVEIDILEAENLLVADPGTNPSSDPYAKAILVYKKTMKKVKSVKPVKTKTIKENLNPKWEQSFKMNADALTPDNLALHIKVYDADLLKKELLGTLRLPLKKYFPVNLPKPKEYGEDGEEIVQDESEEDLNFREAWYDLEYDEEMSPDVAPEGESTNCGRIKLRTKMVIRQDDPEQEPLVPREVQLNRILKVDKSKEEFDEATGEQKPWCIIEANWINAWLACVNFNTASPAPGAIRNGNLLVLKAMATPDDKRIFKPGEIVEVCDPKKFRDGGTNNKWVKGPVSKAEEGKYFVKFEDEDLQRELWLEQFEEHLAKQEGTTSAAGAEEQKGDDGEELMHEEKLGDLILALGLKDTLTEADKVAENILDGKNGIDFHGFYADFKELMEEKKEEDERKAKADAEKAEGEKRKKRKKKPADGAEEEKDEDKASKLLGPDGDDQKKKEKKKKGEEEEEEKDPGGITYAETRVPLEIPGFQACDRVEVNIADGFDPDSPGTWHPGDPDVPKNWRAGIIKGGKDWRNEENEHVWVQVWGGATWKEPPKEKDQPKEDKPGHYYFDKDKVKLSSVAKLYDPHSNLIRFNDHLGRDKDEMHAGGRYVAKVGIEAASEKEKGHFRLIRKEVWDEYCKIYPGSGPLIICRKKIDINLPANWEIDQDFMHTFRETGAPPVRPKGPQGEDAVNNGADEVDFLEKAVREHDESEIDDLEKHLERNEAAVAQSGESEIQDLESMLNQKSDEGEVV